MTSTARRCDRVVREVAGAICGSNISTCIWCTGRFPTSIRRAAMSDARNPMPSPTSTRITCALGGRWKSWWTAGLVRHIGTSNMTIPKMKLVLRDARIRPAVNEMELHPHFQQPELFAFCRTTESSRWAIARSARPAGRSATARRTTPSPTEDPVIRADRRAARRASGGGLHQVGRAARPNADSVFVESAQLSRQSARRRQRSADRRRDAAIAGIDRNCRLIKGQVFLWKDRPELGRSVGCRTAR